MHVAVSRCNCMVIRWISLRIFTERVFVTAYFFVYAQHVGQSESVVFRNGNAFRMLKSHLTNQQLCVLFAEA